MTSTQKVSTAGDCVVTYPSSFFFLLIFRFSSPPPSFLLSLFFYSFPPYTITTTYCHFPVCLTSRLILWGQLTLGTPVSISLPSHQNTYTRRRKKNTKKKIPTPSPTFHSSYPIPCCIVCMYSAPTVRATYRAGREGGEGPGRGGGKRGEGENRFG